MSSPDYKDIQHVLMEELRLMHMPVAVKFIFSDSELEDFKNNCTYHVPVHPITFCQFEIGPRMKGQTILGTRETLACANADYVFGWKPLDDAEVKAHLRYTKDMEQAERFVKTKSRLPEGQLKTFIVSPLADSYFAPDAVHFYCDTMQAYHLIVDYMAALDVHPLRPALTMNSSACGGCVFSYNENTLNMLTACSGSYNSGKTERGEINVMIPGGHIALTTQRLLERKKLHGSSSITRPGDQFPGADVCKNCPLIICVKSKDCKDQRTE
ncbi:MAG: DUF169 domain-containing protein [Nitrospirae bacterium]|nr:DUF169 domain-containing protein [Nitrospirota bacterium]